MKKLILLFFFFYAEKGFSQTTPGGSPFPPALYNFMHIYTNICTIQYEYDNAGNRTSRIFECGTNPFYFPLTAPDPGGGGSNSRTSNESTSDASIIVFPNPSQGMFYIKLPEPLKECLVEVRDMNGKIIYKELVTQFEKGINISALANGQYSIHIITGEQTQLVKLSKQN